MVVDSVLVRLGALANLLRIHRMDFYGGADAVNGDYQLETRVIDADTHVVEDVSVWDYFRAAASVVKPYLVETVDPATGVRRHRWVVDGRLAPPPPGRGAFEVATPPIAGYESGNAGEITWAWRSMGDVAGRIADAKKRGVDRQVIYPTVFLADLTKDPVLQGALSVAYNRFLAEKWFSADGAFSWVIVPPLLDVPAALEELTFGKAHGAVGILFHGLEADRSLGDPYFGPIYERAEELDLAICIHTGAGSRTMLEFQDSRYTRNFGQNRVLPLIAFHDLVFGNVPERFPGLRFGFLEATASWVPFLLHFFRRSAPRSGRDPEFFGPQLFKDFRFYVACESDEDIGYLARSVGWDHLLIGSDYGHTDQSLDLEISKKLSTINEVGLEQYRMILSVNPSNFYGLVDN